MPLCLRVKNSLREYGLILSMGNFSIGKMIITILKLFITILKMVITIWNRVITIWNMMIIIIKMFITIRKVMIIIRKVIFTIRKVVIPFVFVYKFILSTRRMKYKRNIRIILRIFCVWRGFFPRRGVSAFGGCGVASAARPPGLMTGGHVTAGG